jgi:hypothetical protein
MYGKSNCILFLVLTLIAGSNLNAQVDPGTKNLTHSWTFDDGTPNDYVGGANGTLKGGASIWRGALVTSAQGQWMEMPADIINLNTYDSISIAAWYTPSKNANPNFTMLAFFGYTQNTVGVNYYFITAARQDNVSRTAISCGNTSTPWSAETGVNGPEYDDGNLHFMVSTLTNDSIKLFIDDTLCGAKRLDTNNAISKISPAYAYLAKSGYTGDAQWIGQIHEFDIYDKVLDSAEIDFLFQKGIPTGVNEPKSEIPGEYSLSQNYPNPLNPTTAIGFILAKSGRASLVVYDMLGRTVANLIDGKLGAGFHKVNFDGSRLPSGVYFYSLKAGGFSDVKKLMILK